MGMDKKRDRPAGRSREKGGATVNARLRQGRSNGMLVRLRAQAMPHYLLGGVAAGGTVAGWIGPAVTTPGTAGAGVAAAGVVGALVAHRRAGWRGLLAAAAATCWGCWTASTGITWDALAVLAVGGYAAALPWWRRHRLPDPPAQQLPEQVEVDEMHPARLWERHIAGGQDALPGSWLSGEETIPTGLRYQVHLVPGRQTLGTAQAALPKLRTGLRLLPGQDLILEQHPTADESIIRMTIVRRSRVLTTAQRWPGPAEVYDPDRGTIRLGPYVDGDGTAEWLLARDNRLYGGFLAGSTGSGKSRLLESIALGAAAAGCTVWFADPQGGASSSLLADRTDMVARDIDGIRAMLATARRIKVYRQAENAYHRWEGWTPQQGRRGLLIVIDECHTPLVDDQILVMATEMAREGGKVGIALVLASQVASLDAFGGSEALRSNVVAGNVVLMRLKSKVAKNLLPGVDVDPSVFPRIAGYGYLVDDTGTRRSAPMRGYYLTDEGRDHAAASVTWHDLDPGSAAAAGDAYQQRHQQAAKDREALGALLTALAAGHNPELPAVTPAQPPARVPVPRFPSPPEIQAAPARTAVLDRAAVPPASAPTAVEAVAELLAAGVTSPGEIQQRSGYSETRVREALRQLAAQGRACRIRHGVWKPVG